MASIYNNNYNKKTKVSIIVPTLNSERYLNECLDSIAGQTLKNIEIICVDAGSTDNTLKIIKEKADLDSRIKLLHSPKKSYGYQMNMGLNSANGEYIGIVESDDFVELKMFECLYNIAEKNSLDLVKSGFFNYYSKPTPKDVPSSIPTSAPKDVFFPVTNKFMESTEFFNMSPSIWAGIYRTKFIRDNHIAFMETPGASYQDTAFTFKVWCCAKRVKFVDECLLHYRRDNDDSSSNSKGKVYCVVDEYKEEERFLLEEQPQIKEWGIRISSRLKYGAYLWNYKRLTMPENLEFLKYASKEFNSDMIEKKFKKEYFSSYQWKVLEIIIRDYKAFHIVNTYGNNWKKDEQIIAMQSIAEFDAKKAQLQFDRKFRLLKDNAITKPVVSVMIPVYNIDKYIETCIQSISTQTLKNIEIICVDDGSTDDSIQIVLQQADRDKRISVYIEKNCGQSIARNNAAQVAKGEYLYFMDGDDVLESTALENLVGRMKKDSLDIVYFDAESFCEENVDRQKLENYRAYYHRQHKYDGVFKGAELLSLMQRNKEYRVSPVLQMFHQKFYRDNKLSFPEGIIHEDNAFTFEAMLQAERVGYINRCYYKRRIRSGSTMTKPNSWDNVYGYFKCHMEMIAFIKQADNIRYSIELYEIIAGVLKNARNIYFSLPWDERQIFLALNPLEKILFNLYIIESESSFINQKKISADNRNLQFDLDAIQHSVSFQLGRKITWLPRKLRGGIWCLRDNGLEYTLKRIIEHMGIDMKTGDFKKVR